MRQNEQYNYIAKTLRCLRVKADFSQQNIADMLNLNRSTYTYYETGKTTPDVRTLYKISRIFQVPVEIFFPPEEGMPVFEDSKWKTEKIRPRKAISVDPQRVGDLTPDEKSLIALLRSDTRFSIQEVIASLKRKQREEDEHKADGK